MARTQQTIVNRKNSSIYVSVEMWPECFELEPGEKLTLVWDAPDNGEAAQIDFINDRELIVWPNGDTDGMQFLVNDEPARDRSWSFKHK
jgi:hypothetical protein